MKQYTTILFDVDGTLLDFDSAEERGLASVFKEYEENGMEYYIEVDYCCGKCCSRCNRRAGYDIIKRN